MLFHYTTWYRCSYMYIFWWCESIFLNHNNKTKNKTKTKTKSKKKKERKKERKEQENYNLQITSACNKDHNLKTLVTWSTCEIGIYSKCFLCNINHASFIYNHGSVLNTTWSPVGLVLHTVFSQKHCVIADTIHYWVSSCPPASCS